jgi:hypothetical protein
MYFVYICVQMSLTTFEQIDSLTEHQYEDHANVIPIWQPCRLLRWKQHQWYSEQDSENLYDNRPVKIMQYFA